MTIVEAAAAAAAASASWPPVLGFGRAGEVILCSQHGFRAAGLRKRLVSSNGRRTAERLPLSPPSLSPSISPGPHRLLFLAHAVESTQASSATSGKTIVPDNEFSLAKVSFGVIGLAVGGTLLSYGFGAYFSILPGSEWSALMLTYGFPLAIIGMALKYAELKPVPCITYSDAEALRETCATPILKQVRNDVTRYRYGDEQHLDEALKRIFQYGQGGGIPRRSAPTLQMIREEKRHNISHACWLVTGMLAGTSTRNHGSNLFFILVFIICLVDPYSDIHKIFFYYYNFMATLQE
ncbi:uncharacterized protein LOC103704861 isoform X2 [Phoenix dactylifera]|uniref:Uncharacterized protein LOC103704861 isoform X2 n=1 Tax=Phoenix dactylifera TaxID=42345 RepID=A0A8B8J331_PHODC|nr:uncharacterized protein LOC103704861 isoform X2 [Phoenix dactylifera]